MSGRWKMNRMGFVNFWLYDEEVFEFEDGKLLLRGQNGSGKSITTQSFIPFILDGDRTPSRLDPFGSGDRKMEYYFIGEEGKDESTGYLFLEFKKDPEKYCTVGIGQRARRGAPMTFWGFVLNDGRRIGYDLNLYKEAGNVKVPYSKADLKKVLGPEVPFTDVQGEYKEMVNRYIFGFRRMEQYDQFIRLLIKVRAPKLSKEFKPTKVYEILNESLQTLTDEELRAMVDAMEKMDSIQNSLEHLKAAYKDALIIQTEYTRYNQFMLGRKAKAYLDASEMAEKQKERLEKDEEELSGLNQEEREKREVFLQTEQKKRVTDAQLDSMKDTDLDKVTERLEENQNRSRRLTAEKQKWEQKAEEAREHLIETDRKLREYGSLADLCRSELDDRQEELEEQQEILQSDIHQRALQVIRQEETAGIEEITKEIREWKARIGNGLKILIEQEELERKYDLAAQESARCLARKTEREDELEALSEREEQARDAWIEACFALPENNQEMIPERWLLKELEAAITSYQGVKDRTGIRKMWEECEKAQEKCLRELQNDNQLKLERLSADKKEKQEQLLALKEQKDWEPERSQERVRSRSMLSEAGISWIPFYQAVDFAPQLSEEEKNLLEDQLKEAGFLDALVAERQSWERIRTEFPEYADSMICAPACEAGACFDKLVPCPGLSDGLRKEVEYILRAVSGDGTGLVLKEDGFFRNGLLEGRSLGQKEASFVGAAARKRKLEQRIAALLEELEILEEQEKQVNEEKMVLKQRVDVLEQEFLQAPDGGALDEILDREKECRWQLSQEQHLWELAKQEEERLKREKDQVLQKVIRMGKELPYARTSAAYREAENAAEEYLNLWTETGTKLHSLDYQKKCIESEKEKEAQYEENQDMALGEISEKKHELEILTVTIRQAEEFLNRPENLQRAKELTELRTEKKRLEEVLQETGRRLAVIEGQKAKIEEQLEEKKSNLAEAILQETNLRSYFEEEWNLGISGRERGTKSLKECASESWGNLRESDRNREATAMSESLYQVYHKYSGSLVSYGTAMEDCFPEGAADGKSLRKRQRILSVWNGRKLYFAQFCQALKASIEETELLIQEKDRELFVDILSRTLSQQLTGRIEESRQWIKNMSALMHQMDTSMGLSFSLEWKAKTAESDQEMDTQELEKLLRRDHHLLTSEDVERVARHFRSKIRAEKARLEDEGGVINYMDMVRDALDYRKWFEFQMYYYRNQEGRKPLTNAAFNKFSGGEKAMAMYVPLFAAVNAQYQKSSKTDFPRIIALDEAFAGVDDKNISSMFKLVTTLDFDYIMNSQAVWGCYETVPALRISELYRPADAQTVTAIHYTWNGHERILDEQ